MAAVSQAVRVEPAERAGGSGRPKVLIMPRHPTSWVRMLDLAAVLQAGGELEPVMVLATPAMARNAEACRARGLAVIQLSEAIERPLQGPLAKLEAWAARHDRLGNLLPVSLLRIRHLRRRLRHERKIFERLCRAENPLAVFVAGDRELSPVPAMLRVGLDLGIPTIIAFSGAPDPIGPAGFRLRDKRFRVSLKDLPPLLNFYVAWRYPKQVFASDLGRMLFSPGWLVLALDGLGMLSADPWTQGNGNSRFLLQNSRRRMQHFIERGVPKEKHVFIGDPTLDRLHDSYRRRHEVRAQLIASHGLAKDRPLVVVSVPNDAEHGVCDWDTHLKRQEAFMAPLAAQRAEVLLSLHPKSDPANYAALAERFGFRFADRPLVEILPAADLFVCCASSTILWASIAAVPAINLDYLEWRNHEFDHLPGVTNVKTPEAFGSALQEALRGEDEEARAARLAQARSIAEDTRFDGRAGERLRHFLVGLAAPAEAAGEERRESA